MANSMVTVFASVLISLVVGAGVAFVALPTVYPSLKSTSTSTTDIDTYVDKGIVQSVLKTWQDESYIFDNEL